jgi:Putative Actinobacterial Holin-X, holin superfamily III
MSQTPESQTSETAQAGVADAVQGLTTQTEVLIRREIDAALHEMRDKARHYAPGVVLLAASGALGLMATASAYRLSLRLLEKRLPRTSAALIAVIGYSAAASAAGLLATQRLRNAPPPLPTQTARATSEAIAEARSQD